MISSRVFQKFVFLLPVLFFHWHSCENRGLERTPYQLVKVVSMSVIAHVDVSGYMAREDAVYMHAYLPTREYKPFSSCITSSDCLGGISARWDCEFP